MVSQVEREPKMLGRNSTGLCEEIIDIRSSLFIFQFYFCLLYLYVKAGWLKIFADKGVKSKSLKTIVPEGKTMILV